MVLLIHPQQPAGAVTFRSAELIIDNFGAVETDGISKVAEWDVRLQNDAAATTAGNSWIGFNSTSGNITVDSVRDLTSMMLLTESSGIYQAGDVLAGGSPNARIFKVYASYNNCIRDTIRAFSGWDCDGYPANLADYSCPKDSTDLVLVPLYPVLQTDLITPTSPPTVDMCDTVNYIVEVSQRDAARSYDNTIELDMSPGVSIVPDSSYVEFMEIIQDTGLILFSFQEIGIDSMFQIAFLSLAPTASGYLHHLPQIMLTDLG
jgi:hypothetical protein